MASFLKIVHVSRWCFGRVCGERVKARPCEGPFSLPVAGMMVISSGGSNYSSKSRGGSGRWGRPRAAVLITLIFTGHRARDCRVNAHALLTAHDKEWISVILILQTTYGAVQ